MYTLNFQTPCSLYFVGIGGVSMSGLAELLATEGFTVSGSDRARSKICATMEEKGIHIFYGQRYENITSDIDCAVLTSAISKDNPEYKALIDKQIPILSRGELMGQVMKNYGIPVGVSGTHGKTTTTSMISEILLKADLDPTLFVGGMLKSIDGNLRIGHSQYFVTEACEYTNSFLSFFPKIGIILNIEEDHLDFFKDLADIRASFRKFAQLLPKDGCLIINDTIDNLSEITDGLECRIVTFSNSSCGNYHPQEIHFDALGHPCFTLKDRNGKEHEISLKIPGLHNVSNACAAFALADVLELDMDACTEVLSQFTGADRRFQFKGTIGGVNVIDDYAHHPTEIAATLTAAKSMPHNTLWCVFQPHNFTRTKAFMKDFAKSLSIADRVILASIYPARETDNLGISSGTLQQEILALGHSCEYFETFDEIENFLLKNCINGDMLITMGAGDVHKIGENLLGN